MVDKGHSLLASICFCLLGTSRPYDPAAVLSQGGVPALDKDQDRHTDASATPVIIASLASQATPQTGNTPAANYGSSPGTIRKLRQAEENHQRLESEVRKLKAENESLRESLQQARSSASLTASEASASAARRIEALEERLQRLTQEAEADMAQTRRRHAQELESADGSVRAAKEAAQRAAEKARDEAEAAHSGELERLQKRHADELSEKDQAHRRELDAQRRLREEEITGLLGARENAKSLQDLLLQVKTSAQDVSSLQARLDSSQAQQLAEREQRVAEREQALAGGEESLAARRRAVDEQTAQLHDLQAKLEVDIRNQGTQQEQERWKTAQDAARITAQQQALDEERARSMEQVAAAHAELQAEREAAARERQAMLSELADQRRMLAADRAAADQRRRQQEAAGARKENKLVESTAEMERAVQQLQRDGFELETKALANRKTKADLAAAKRRLQKARDQLVAERAEVTAFAEDIAEKSRLVAHQHDEAVREHQLAVEAQEAAELLRVAVANERVVLSDLQRSLSRREEELAAGRASLMEAEHEAELRGVEVGRPQRIMAQNNKLLGHFLDTVAGEAGHTSPRMAAASGLPPAANGAGTMRYAPPLPFWLPQPPCSWQAACFRANLPDPTLMACPSCSPKVRFAPRTQAPVEGKPQAARKGRVQLAKERAAHWNALMDEVGRQPRLREQLHNHRHHAAVARDATAANCNAPSTHCTLG